MLRVKDPKASLGFYRDLLGMRLLAVKHFSDFSLYFLAQPAALPPSPISSHIADASKCNLRHSLLLLSALSLISNSASSAARAYSDAAVA